jgi:hypothetical protein
MSAVWYDRQGAADEVLVCGELPTPEAGQGEVRVPASGTPYQLSLFGDGRRCPDSAEPVDISERRGPNPTAASRIDRASAAPMLEPDQSQRCHPNCHPTG